MTFGFWLFLVLVAFFIVNAINLVLTLIKK